VDGDALAARVPSLLNAARGLSNATQRGELLTAVLEHEAGVHVLSVLSPDAILIVLITPDANLGELLFDLRRNRNHFASVL
jgi:predicted regulator of Ras-like GTPase activity (Roadblock/LC7/MglB family)